MWPRKHKYDVFISHAVEDKIPVADELCSRLEKMDLHVWYSGRELTAGDDLEKTIVKGLAQSRYGVVVLSPIYLRKNWAMREFYMLLDKEMEYRKVIIPVLHNITVAELQEVNIIMAAKWAIPMTKGMDFVVAKIVETVRTPRGRQKTIGEWFDENAYALKFWAMTVLLVGLISALALSWQSEEPSDDFLEREMGKRLVQFDPEPRREIASLLSVRDTTVEAVKNQLQKFWALEVRYRNEYEFENGSDRIRAKVNVSKALNVEVDKLSPDNNYGFMKATVQAEHVIDDGTGKRFSFAYINMSPVEYQIVRERTTDEGYYEAVVVYKENIRSILVQLIAPASPDGIKKHRMKLLGFYPKEKLLFEKSGSQWVLKSVTEFR